MVRRIGVWSFSLLVALGLLSAARALLARPAREDIAGGSAPVARMIVNEWSQGNGGRKEWVELLATGGPLDLRGWDLGDSAPGVLTFSDHPLWQVVPTGTLIVVYNGNDPDLILPAIDTDVGDGLLVLAHNDAAFFAGTWPALANDDFDDNPHLRDAADQTVHNFSEAPGSSRHPEAAEATWYMGATAAGVANESWWSDDGPAAEATPGRGNSTANRNWIAALRATIPSAIVDLQLGKEGPPLRGAGEPIPYRLELSNVGTLTATGVVLTDVLPLGFAYAGDDSGLALVQPGSNMLVWTVGTMPPGARRGWWLTATTAPGSYGVFTNSARASTLLPESDYADNAASATTVIESADGSAPVVIDAVLYDGYAYQDADEAVRLRNVGQGTVQIGGWRLTDGNSGEVTLPAGAALAPGDTLWLAKDAEAFRRQFGFPPGITFAGGWPGFANKGDEVLLLREDGLVVDGVAYKEGVGALGWWQGPPVVPYTVPYILPEEGQILYRRLLQSSGQPVVDSNGERDWAQTRGAGTDGRLVQYPGWSLERFFFTTRVTETARLTVAIAPDNAFDAVLEEVAAARQSIYLESLTFENVALGEAFAAAARRGVSVTVLLEGDPAGGIADAERYICQKLAADGGRCWFMVREDTLRIHDRYRYLHAKFMVVDGKRALVSSENMSPNSLPDDDKGDGTWGRRGVILITDAPSVVSRLQEIFFDDFDPAAHQDLVPWRSDDPDYGIPPAGFVPLTVTGGTTYTLRFTRSATFSGTFDLEVVQAPENSLRDEDALLGLVGQAGAGDTILVEQLSERPHWGAGSSNAEADPNPRLEAYLEAARRGARVRLLLDSFFDERDDALSNWQTCAYARDVALREHLNVRCALGNPTGLGIHNKMVLAKIDGRGWVHAGSLNGTEQAAKGNREVALQVQSDEAYHLLADMFYGDWPYRTWFPIFFHEYQGPADHILISEVLYDPLGLDDAEFVELVNPTHRPVDMSGWQLGDATDPDDFEDMRRFPEGTRLEAHSTLVVAFSAPPFRAAFGQNPDFEIYPSDHYVPDLEDDLAWGDPAAWLQLGNAGDEVILRDAAGTTVDVLTYGNGAFPGVVAAPLVGASHHSLERYPFWLDTDDCALDFREWPLPDPGGLPIR